MMKRIATVLTFLVATGSTGFAQYQDLATGRESAGNAAYSIPKITIRGYLVDKTCAYRESDLDGFGAKHSTACSLAASSPLGLVQHGVFYPFDEKGTKKALELLKKSKLSQGVMVQATGNMGDSAFAVSSLKELKPD
jgi:hypothetical protein